jgi:hypothetical protein
MKKAATIFLTFFLLFCFLLFNLSRGFVTTIDREETRNNIELFDDLVYDKVTASIYQNGKDKNYKLVFDNIDSLYICDERILFSNSNKQYTLMESNKKIEVINLKDKNRIMAQHNCLLSAL